MIYISNMKVVSTHIDNKRWYTFTRNCECVLVDIV